VLKRISNLGNGLSEEYPASANNCFARTGSYGISVDG